MEVQLLPPSPAIDFTYSTTTTPYTTAPSSPQSTIPFTWEQTPGIPKQHSLDFTSQYVETETESDFAFGYLERHSISAADELFDGGKIKPLKPPPRLHHSNDSPKSPKKLGFKQTLSPRGGKKKEFVTFDPFSEALKQTCGDQTEFVETDSLRGLERERSVNNNNNNRHKVSRSFSPFRVVDILNNRKKDQSSSMWYSKWNLKSLFRSVSEGSAKKNHTTSFSFRSVDDDDSGSTVTEDVMKKKKNDMQCKSGLMSCLRFHQNGGSVHEISRGISSVMKQ